jgi:hypothetical protein
LIDASIFGELNEFCMDACLHNAQGQFIKAITRWFDGNTSSHSECNWIREAIICYGELGVQKYQFS